MERGDFGDSSALKVVGNFQLLNDFVAFQIQLVYGHSIDDDLLRGSILVRRLRLALTD